MSEPLERIKQFLQNALAELEAYKKTLNVATGNALKQLTDNFSDVLTMSR